MGDIGAGSRRLNGVAMQHQPMATESDALGFILDVRCPFADQPDVLRRLAAEAARRDDGEIPSPAVFPQLPAAVDFDTTRVDPGSRWQMVSTILYWRGVDDVDNPLTDDPSRSHADRANLGRREARQLRHYFGPSHACLSALYHPICAVCCVILAVHPNRVVVGNCNPILCPIWGCRPAVYTFARWLAPRLPPK